MKVKQFLISIFAILITVFSVVAIVFATHNLYSSKQTSESTFHSLNDIYNLIITGATSNPSSLTSTTSEPVATTSHSIGEIYTILANMKVNKATSTYGSLVPVAAPGGTGYTLENIWDLIHNSTYVTEGNHDFTKSSAPSASMHTTSEIYDYLNTTFRDNLNLSKIRNGAYYFGSANPGTFVIGEPGDSCEYSDECSTNFCETYNGKCSTGEEGQPCVLNNECLSGFCESNWLMSCTTGEVDAYCDSNEDCLLGFCDTSYVVSEPKCTTGGEGSYCAQDSECLSELYCDLGSNICSITDGQIDSGCGSNSDCLSGFCNQIEYYCTDGSPLNGCSNGSQCASGYCNTDFMECTTGELNQPCGANGDCISNYCGYDYNAASSFCTDGSIDSGCSNNSSCASGYCDGSNWKCTTGALDSGCNNNNQCQSKLCSSVTNLCISGEVDTSCTVAQECSNGFCGGGKCTNGVTGVDTCELGEDCVSGYCDTSSGFCKADGAIGSACGLHSECDSEFCSSNVCTTPTLTSRLSAYWNFDETSGTTFADASGNGKSGSLVNGTLVNQAGKVGTAFKFDGSNDRASVTDIDIANSSFTFSIWIANTGTGNGGIFYHGTSGANKQLHIMRGNLYGGKAYFGFFGNDLTASSVISSSGTWEHWVFVYKLGVGKKIYKNGVLDATGGGAAYQAPAGSLTIGSVFGGQYFKGTMDEVGLWNRALTADEVTQLYNDGTGLPYSSF